MTIPVPSIPLVGDCSAINNGTLYVYSHLGFQSLGLHENATWSTLPTGELVTGPACATGSITGDDSSAALYLIGGVSNDTSYGGIQRYVFSNSSWETLNSSSPPVLQGRQNHTATYLNDTQSILVYAGSQPDTPSYLSSQTFVLSTMPPYNIESYTSNAPPGNNPILEPWNSSHAVMLGGSDFNNEIWTFQPSTPSVHGGWSQFQTDLPSTLDGNARAQIIHTSDEATVLELYDLSVSPNNITDYVLLDASGQPAATGTIAGSNSTGSARRTRDLSINNWPQYNSSEAPTHTWNGCGLAMTADGLVVLSGGSSDSKAPIALFNQRENTWLDADQFFGGQHPLQPSSTPTTSSTPSTPAGGSNNSAHNNSMRTLGIVLGVVLGLAAVIAVALLYLRHRKLKAQRARKDLEEKDDADNRMSFADRGDPFMKEAGVTVDDDLEPPQQSIFHPKHNSNSSLAIIAGKFGPGSNRHSSNHVQKSSYDSTAHLVKEKRNSSILGEPVEMVDLSRSSDGSRNSNLGVAKDAQSTQNRMTLAVPGTEDGADVKKTRRNRSSGWSKYFATSAPAGPNGLSHLPSAYARRETFRVSSIYSEARPDSTAERVPSTVLPPSLDLNLGNESRGVNPTTNPDRFSGITSASHESHDEAGNLAHSNSSIASQATYQPATGTNPRNSQAASISSYAHSTISSQMSSEYYNYSSAHTPWTPMSGAGVSQYATGHLSTGSDSFFADGASSVGSSRPDSGSTFGASSVPPGMLHDLSTKRPSRGKSVDFFPGAGTSYRPIPRVKISRPPLPLPAEGLSTTSDNKAVPAAAQSASVHSSPSPVPEEDEAAPLSPLKPPPARAQLFEQASGNKVSQSGEGDDSNGRDSTITLFPSGGEEHAAHSEGESHAQQQQQRGFNTDMSWVDLGS